MFLTLLAAADIPLPDGYESDGENILPLWLGRPFARDKPMFWEWRGNHSQPANWPVFGMRDGPWTLLLDESGDRQELYHVLNDRAQSENLAAANGQRVSAMSEAIQNWKATLPTSPDPKCISANIPSAGSTPDRARTFQRWDRDQNGLLTLQEYTAGLANKTRADARFRRFDKDDDGTVTQQEFVEP
jgi:N-acetylgalactosamine-6-sulfatase